MKKRLLLVACAATVSLAACGGGEDPASTSGASGPSEQSENRKAMLDFARCMRENGIDMPDPQFDGGRVTMRAGKAGQKMDETKMRTAEEACAKYREAVKPPEMSAEQSAEFKEQALAHARCMRENGVDMPDPTFDSNGGARMKLGRGLNPESDKFKQAQEACRDTMPGGPSTTSAGGGEE